jgi:hypothetical protein
MTKQTAEKQRPKKRSAPKQVYISTSRQTDIRPVRQALESCGVKVFSPDQLNLPGRSLAQITRTAMTDADIIILVSDPIEVGFAFYEAGFAQALKKPTVALLSKDTAVEPWIARGIPYLRLDPSATDSVDFIVNQILALPHPGLSPKKIEGAQTKPIGHLADELLEQLRASGKRILEQRLAEIITAAVQASGVRSVSQRGLDGKGERGADIAVWSDDLSPWIANPLPIDLKLHLDRSQSLLASSIQTPKATEGTGALWTLVIYLTSAIPLEPAFLPPNVLVMQAEAFVKALKEKSFGDLMRELRNERVHGRR